MRITPTRHPGPGRTRSGRAFLAALLAVVPTTVWLACVDFAEESGTTDTAADVAADTPDGPVAGEACPGSFTWLDLTAISADREGKPSIYDERDTRAGSVDIHLNGDIGFGGNEADPSHAAGYMTLRNGAGAIVEELQINRRYKPMRLGADGCALDASFPQCWIDVPREPGGGTLEIGLPYQVESSNVDFDLSGDRVAVSGTARIELGEKPPRDNAHETVRITWDAPAGLDGARLLLRAGFRVDDSDAAGWVVPLLTSGWSERGDGLEVDVSVIEEVERTDTRLTVEVNAERAMRYLCGFVRGCGVRGEDRLELTGNQALWHLTNESDEMAAFDALQVTWPAENGALEELRLGRRNLLAAPVAASPLRLRLEDMPEAPVVPPGRTVRLTMRFAEPVARESDTYYVRFDSEDGCMVELAHKSCRVSPAECLGRRLPLALTLAYVGTDCGASTFAQDRSGVDCQGDPKFASPVRVVVSDGELDAGTAPAWFDATVERSERFVIDPAALDRPALPERTRVEIFTPDGEVLQTVTFATSCGVSLIEGDLFGAIRLAGCDVPAGGE